MLYGYLNRVTVALVGSMTICGFCNGQDFFGPRITLRTTANTYMQAWGGGFDKVYGNSSSPWEWEQFYLYDLNGGDLVHGDVIALKTVKYGLFVSDDGATGPAFANRNNAWGWELFQIDREGGAGALVKGDAIWLRTTSHFPLFLGQNRNLPGWPVGAWFSNRDMWEKWFYDDLHWNDSTKGNCVEYAKSRVPSMGNGWLTWTQKLSKRNVSNVNGARPGDVALVDTGTGGWEKDRNGNRYWVVYGHVAVVEQFKDGIVTIRESNFGRLAVTSRKGTPSSLKIVGYFRP